jgi:tetratricopeptide (TPR) repeat protein
MIVKNESRIIKRCLDSVLPIIDSYCIVDTGSTDGTQDIIRETLKELPGEIIERPWVNFGHNRQEALDFGRKWGDFLLLVDADMVLRIKNSFNKSMLDKSVDSYEVIQVNGSLSYYNLRLVNTRLRWKCIGVTHEYYGADGASERGSMDHLWFDDISDGGSKGDKFERDIKLLTQGLIDEPNNERYMFYLAQSYKDSGNTEEAINWYVKRIEAGGWREEVWYSYYMITSCYVILERLDVAEKWAMDGYKYYPARSEALYLMCKTYRIKGLHEKSYKFYKIGSVIQYPEGDRLFINYAIYNKKLFEYEYSIIHYYLFPEKRIDGLRSSVSYINKIGENFDIIYANLKFYAPNLSDECNFIDELLVNESDEYRASSPCYITLRSGEEIGNIRFVNYRINRSSGSYLYNSNEKTMGFEETHINPISTINYFSDGTLMEVIQNVYHNPKSNIQGLEDIRIFEREDESIIFMATGKDHSDDGKIKMCSGRYDHQEKKIHVDRILESPHGRDCEKNWTLLNDNEFVYEWFPLSIYSLDRVEKIRSYDTPRIFRNFRGSTNAITDGNLKYFLVHSVNYETPRTYLHYIVATDLNGKPIFYSLPFSFEGQKIEYCLSMKMIGNDFEFYYSTWDSSPKVLSVKKSYFFDKIVLA